MKEVCISFDNDTAGEAIAKELSKVLSTKVSLMKLSEKDASDMHQRGKDQEFVSAFFDAKVYTPSGIIQVADVYDQAIKMPTYGRPWPWKTLTELTYGRRGGEGIYVGAGVKIGKSEFVNQMIQHVVQVEGLPVAVFKFEEDPSMTVRRVAGKIKHKQFHKPDGDFTQEELIAGVKSLDGKVYMYDTYHMDTGSRWDQIKPIIKHLASIGVKDFFFDPITDFTDGLTAADTDVELRRLSKELAALSKDLDFFYYCFCHLKAPATGKPHEEGGRVHSNQFRGSRAMMEKTYFMLGIERNKLAEDIDEKNMSTFVLLEDRAFGNTGRFPVFYNNATGDYLEQGSSDLGF